MALKKCEIFIKSTVQTAAGEKTRMSWQQSVAGYQVQQNLLLKSAKEKSPLSLH
jgi:hypothetical protein